MIKTTAKAPANIAFIKYWGKKNEALRIPENDSLAMCLDGEFTLTTVEFKKELLKDKIFIDGKEAQGEEKKRIVKHLERIRAEAKIRFFAKVESQNNFPKASGLASSASGFAALTLAASAAAGLDLSERELSSLARFGSGSACRSIPSGFTYWQAGDSDKTSYAYSLYEPSYWKLQDLVVIVETNEKKVSSSEGHRLAGKNPFLKARLKLVEENLRKAKKAFENKDFHLLGQVIESEALSLHSVMLTSKPALIYWQPETLAIIHRVIALRKQGLEGYFTIDAGPNVHVICEENTGGRLKKELRKVKGVKKVINNRPTRGAGIISKHLF